MRHPSPWIAASAVALALGCSTDESGPGIAPKPPADETQAKAKAPETLTAPGGKKLLPSTSGEMSLTPEGD